jgi:dTDP-4-dehydrorhamnose reductase
MKIVILGASGQVGRETSMSLPAVGEVIAFDQTQADFERPDEVVTLLARQQPDVIVNCAAYTAVDRAESEPKRAELINATTVAAIAHEARRQDALLIHYSTDYVFDGMAPECSRETDPTGPLSVYGHTKLAGEQAVTASGCRHYTFRTSWVYATHGANFLRTMLRLAAEREDLAVVADQRGVPTSAVLIADVTTEIVRRSADQATALPSGIYNLTPTGATTWHGFAVLALTAARDCGMTLRVSPERITPLTTSDYPTAARRPANSLLCTEKLASALARKLPEWQDGVRAAVAQLAAASLV